MYTPSGTWEGSIVSKSLAMHKLFMGKRTVKRIPAGMFNLFLLVLYVFAGVVNQGLYAQDTRPTVAGLGFEGRDMGLITAPDPAVLFTPCQYKIVNGGSS